MALFTMPMCDTINGDLYSISDHLEYAIYNILARFVYYYCLPLSLVVLGSYWTKDVLYSGKFSLVQYLAELPPNSSEENFVVLNFTPVLR